MVFVGVAGMAAALPGAITSHTGAVYPVIGVSLVSEVLDGQDALYSIVRMPPGMPVAVPGIGKSGLKNATLLACQIVVAVRSRLVGFLAARQKPVHLTRLSG